MRLIEAGDLWSEIMMLPHNGDMISSEEVEQAIINAPIVDALPLRCRIGDTVWIVGSKCMSGLYDDECPDKCEWNSFDDFCKDCPLDYENIVFSRKVTSCIFTLIHDLERSDSFRWGETVFKTKEEAEAALAKMGGGKDG